MGRVSQVQDAIEGYRRTWARTRQWRDRLLRLAGIAVLVVAIAWVEHFGRSVTTPDVEGMNVHGAIKELNEAGIPFDADGVYGFVTQQWPRAGEPWYRWQEPSLTYEYRGEESRITGG